MNTRILGTIGMLASPMLFISGMIADFQTIPANRIHGALGLVFILGWICSAIGLRRLQGTGVGMSSKIVYVIQLLGLTLAGSQQVQEIIYQPPETSSLAYQIADAAWPLSVLFMLVVGLLAIVAKTIKGWQRFTPLLCGLALPLFILTNIAVGKEVAMPTFGVYTMVAWMLFGYTIRRAARSSDIHLARSVQTTQH